MRNNKKTAETSYRIQSNELTSGYHHNTFPSYRIYTSDRYIEFGDGSYSTDKDGVVVENMPRAYGLEVETSCSKINDSKTLSATLSRLIYKDFPNELYKFESDCSLDGLSTTEMIFQPRTKERIRNEYPLYKRAYELYPLFGISCKSDITNCGMHCNISPSVFGKNAENLP